MNTITEVGGIICPAESSIYNQPKTFEALASKVGDRVLDLCNLDLTTYRWGEK